MHRHNMVAESIAYIFVSSAFMRTTWTNYKERAEKARLLFEKVLEFKEVRLYLDLGKAEIIEIF